MKCPVCDVELSLADRQGIEIDYCPKCRGVWLDRGEIDKIIERSVSSGSEKRRDGGRDPEDQKRDEWQREYREDDDRYRPKKRKSFLGEMFDF